MCNLLAMIFVVRLHVLLLLCYGGAVAAAGRQQGDLVQRESDVFASKGKFMVHMLHSAYFFPQTVDVKWSASARGKPTLPVWLHLFHSRHRAIAYLVGTPVTPLSHVVIHVIAKQLDSYHSADQLITIHLTDDVRYNTSTQQIAEIRVRNVEAEDFIGARDDSVRRLEKAIHETFRGKTVNPYIYNIIPQMQPPPEDYFKFAHKYKIGSIVQIGTQRHFHANVHRIVDGLSKNHEYCNKSSYVPMDKHFRQANLDVDWCKFEIRNMTMIKALEVNGRVGRNRPLAAAGGDREFIQIIGVSDEVRSKAANTLQIGKAESRQVLNEIDDTRYRTELSAAAGRGSSFFETVVVFPLLAVFCIILLLVLSMIFFGRREGQHWRDYKTSKERLQEYLDVRESQRHLRELSVQRQILFMSSDQTQRGKSQTPLSINTFLQSRSQQPSVPSTPTTLRHCNNQYYAAAPAAYTNAKQERAPPLSASQPRLPTSSPALSGRQPMQRRANSGSVARGENGNGTETITPRRNGTPRSSLGKQTVAEAARATGSSLHLYRNPLDDDANDDGSYYGGGDSAKYDTATQQRLSGYGNTLYARYSNNNNKYSTLN